MVQVLGETLALVAGIALSPVPIIAAILMLLSPRARSTAPAFLIGWFVGIVVALVVFIALASVLPDAGETGPQPVIGVIKIVLGLLLFVLAIRQWRSRPKKGEEAKLPGWMASIDTMKAPRAFVLAFLLSAVNPKNLVLAASAGIIVGSAGLSVGSVIGVVAILAVIASLTIALPVILYLVASKRMAGPLDSLRAWLSQNNAAVMATLFLVFAFVVIGKGLSSF